MKKIILLVAVLLLPQLGLAAGGSDVELEEVDINPRDLVSLQNGAKLYVNYCLGCHSMKYMRYETLAKDLEIPEHLVVEHLMNTPGQLGDQMRIAMSEEHGKAWFGTPPPDLTLEARLRGADWLYSYLIGFEKDPSRPFGYNNKVFPDVGMPYVLEDLETELGAEGFKSAMRDLTNFMAYTADPVKVEREELGVKVLLFLVILLIPAYLLKREYWKDVH